VREWYAVQRCNDKKRWVDRYDRQEERRAMVRILIPTTVVGGKADTGSQARPAGHFLWVARGSVCAVWGAEGIA
jgi:hypothetical protein